MKKIIIFISLCIVSGVFCSCQRDDIGTGFGPAAKKSTLTVSLTLDGVNSDAMTRAQVPPTTEEEIVNKILLVFYETSANHEGKYVTSIVLADGPYYMDHSYTVTDPLLSSDNAYNVVVVGNIDDNLYINGRISELIQLFPDMTEKQFREEVLLDISFPDVKHGIQSDWIPMSGAVTKPAGEGKIDINLKHIVSRLDVANSAAGYELTSASVWNAVYHSTLLGDGVTDYSPTEGLRTRKYYNATVNENGQVLGSLYAFENQVASPALNDHFTTCLIVGLSDNGAASRYYRINVHPKDSPQHLKRNNAYKISIISVIGDGYDTEEDAYTGIHSGLDYSINYWDLDDNGLIVSDMNSMIAIPVKTALFGRDGGENTYTITTFSNLPAPAPLTLKSQIYSPADGSIIATLNGNILTVTAKHLPDGEPDRTGIITLSYAGLEAVMNVRQSTSVDKYLTVTLEEGWYNELPPTQFAFSEDIYVSASGAWTAKLYDANTGGAFSLLLNEYKTELASADLERSKFRIYTWTENHEDAMREAFVLISLDEDPLNYVAVVPIAQKISSTINLVPDIRRITFDAAGNVVYPTSGSSRLTVSSKTGQLNAPVLTNGSGNNDFLINENITGQTSGHITITASGMNFTSSALSERLTITDNMGGSVEVEITQNGAFLFLSPSTLPSSISETGGKSEYVRLDVGSTGTGLTWSATVVTESDGDIFNHGAWIELEDGSYTGATPAGISVDTRFKIVFPKIYYPNRNRNISATVYITVDGTGMEEEITARQDALTSNGVKIWSNGIGNYGAIGNTYLTAYTAYLRNLIGGISPSSITNNNALSGVEKYTYVHSTSNYFGNNSTALQSFMNNEDGITWFQCDYTEAAYNNLINNGLLGDLGYTVAPATGSYGNYSVTLNTGASATRIYQILVQRGVNEISGSIDGFYRDQISTVAIDVPSTGIVMLKDSNGSAVLVMDPSNGLVYCGECQVFWNATYITGNRELFMRNVVDYVCRSAMYGSHFMDMLIDYEPTDPNAIPAPWDDIWGTNKWNPLTEPLD